VVKALDSVLAGLCVVYLRISQLLLAALVVGILAEVVGRYFFGRGLNGSGELSRLAITWIVFLMGVVLYRRRRHIVVSALVDVMPETLKSLSAAIINICVIALSIFVLVQIYFVWEFLGLKTPVFRIPDPAFKVAAIFCFIPIAAQSVVNLFEGRAAGGVKEI
jgi:TRAP-type C4-dicarboxylate transport system permease small subunit